MTRRRRAHTPLWGTADKDRGILWHPDAVAFHLHKGWSVRPVSFSVSDFDAFAEERRAYTIPKGASRDSPEWRVLLDKRRKFKAHLNLATAHERMLTKEGIEPFYLFVVKAGVTWEARSADQAYKDSRLLRYINKAFDPPVRYISHCLQSAQWPEDEPWGQDIAEVYFGHLLKQAERHTQGLAEIQQEIAALEARIRSRRPLPPKEGQ
jgi:hypothetical protein